MRYTVLTLGLALALPCVSAWAQNTADIQPGAQAPQTNPAPPNAAPANPGAPNPTPSSPDRANPAAPNQAPATPANPAAPNQTTPNAAPQNPAPSNLAPPAPGAPNPAAPAPGQPNPAAPPAEPSPPAPANPPAPAPGAAAPAAGQAGSTPSSLQEFVSHQSEEIGMLASQIDVFKAANRPEVVRALQHMIRDHVLVQNAAQNVLARRNQISQPASMMAPMGIAPIANGPAANTPAENAPAANAPTGNGPMANPPVANTADSAPMAHPPDELIRQDLQAHEQALSEVQQLLAGATTPEERSIYQQSVDATQRHLGWLHSIDQGQQVALGFFGPTAPLSRIAGYREAMAPTGTPSYRSRTAGYRTYRARRHRVHRGSRRRRSRRSRY